MPKKKRGEGEKEFEIPENVTEVEDVRAINGERERKKGRKKESVKMRDIEDKASAKGERKSQPR